MLQRQLFLTSILVLFSSAAIAANGAQTGAVRDNDFSYTWADFGYELWEYDTGARRDLEADSLFARGSHALNEHFHLRGGLSFYSGDGNFDGQRLSVGAGFNTPLQDRLDLVVSGDLVHDNNDIDDENGLKLRGGVRHDTTSEVELAGGVFYENIYEDLDDLGLYGRTLVHVDDRLDFGADVRLGGDIFTLGLFGRYNF
jgi:hypothetical protein